MRRRWAIWRRIDRERSPPATALSDPQDPSELGDPVAFVATVVRWAAPGRGIPMGRVQFLIDREKQGEHLSAVYEPAEQTGGLPSARAVNLHTVAWPPCRYRGRAHKLWRESTWA